MHSLAERVLSHIRREQLLKAGDRVGVAVSGGVDSVALLRLLLELRGELGIVLSVVHFNHKLRGGESDADQEFVANLARAHDLEFHCDSDDVAHHAAEQHVSVETAARELRYRFFRWLLEGNPSRAKAETGNRDRYRSAESAATPKVDKLLTGHTLDDQAETVLMRLIRGAGLRGLGGIYPRIPVEDDDGEVCGEIVRPLLAVRRRELEQYLKDIGQPRREDLSNADTRLTRNRVRKLLVPLLENEFNPAVAENLAELAQIARGEEDYWDNEIAGWMGTTVHWSEPEWARAASGQQSLVQIESIGAPSAQSPSSDSQLRSRIDTVSWLVMNASVSRLWFRAEPAAVQRRLVKAIGEHAGIPLEFKHVEEIVRFAAEEAAPGRELSLPLGWKLLREADELVFLTPDLRHFEPPHDYEYELNVPGATNVAELGSTFDVRSIPASAASEYNAGHLLDLESLPGPLRVRNWRPGDRFWPAHTKSPKKIKELLQERHVAQPERKLWPVVVSGEEIVWLRGFPSPAKFLAKPGRDALVILESPLGGKPAT